MFTPGVMILMSRVSHMWPMFPMLFTLRDRIPRGVKAAAGSAPCASQSEFGGLRPANGSARALHGAARGAQRRSCDRG